MSRFIPQSYQDYPLDRLMESDEQAYCTQQPTTYFNAVRPALWLTLTVYGVGALVHPPTPNGKIYECTVGGTTGGSEPSWGTVQDATFTDGNVTWKVHNNYALVNTARVPGDFAKSTYAGSPGGRQCVVSQKVGVVTHTAGTISHCAFIRSSDRSLRYVSVAQTTLGSNDVEAGRTTIFLECSLKVSDPVAP